MADVVYETVLDWATPLPPGGQVWSSYLDVNGAHTVNVMLLLPTQPDPDVYWELAFGPTGNGANATTNSGTFTDNNILGIPAPVFGPSLLVGVRNWGTRHETVSGMIYFIREVT